MMVRAFVKVCHRWRDDWLNMLTQILFDFRCFCENCLCESAIKCLKRKNNAAGKSFRCIFVVLEFYCDVP